ncbi:MAG: PilN domain-containing protein [Halioglobus sp.]
MLENGQNWELFGYDMRKLGRYWSAAWRDILWGYDSPLRRRFDDVVSLNRPEGAQSYQAGEPCTQGQTDFHAYLLPDELALTRQLRLPIAVESELDSVIGLEVNANSPFAAADTAYGWSRVGRDESHLKIALVIVSRSAVMTYLAKNFDSHDPGAQEVWVESAGSMVVLGGFGEHRREVRYKKRLINVTLMIAACMTLLIALVGLSAGLKRAEMQRMQTMSASIQKDAAVASEMRITLMRANEIIATANEVVLRYPNPHKELTRLSKLLEDDAHLSQFAIGGVNIKLRGQSGDAAAVMQLLTDQPAYTEVTAPQPITRIGGSGLEQFFLNMKLREEEASQ